MGTCEVQNRPELFHEQLTSICWAPIHSVKNHHRLHSSKIRHWGQCRNIESYLKKSGTTNQTNSIQNKIHSLLRYCSKTSSNASLEIELFWYLLSSEHTIGKPGRIFWDPTSLNSFLFLSWMTHSKTLQPTTCNLKLPLQFLLQVCESKTGNVA